MIKEKAMELVQALRSGDYKQGRQYLSADGLYCCLGVACELSKVITEKADTSRYGAKVYDGQSRVLPKSVMKEFGFASSTGCFRTDEMITIDGQSYLDLARANDDGVPFEKLADFIETHWEGL